MEISYISFFLTFIYLTEISYGIKTERNVEVSKITDSNQSKRDLSYSYSAADIGSKEGTHIKTITVIKNIVGKKDKQIKVDPKLHKDENWGSHFRDNFDLYGKIPDVPDIDYLLKNKNNKKPDESATEKTDKSVTEAIVKDSSTEKVNTELTSSAKNDNEQKEIEKIPGDVELINTQTANLQLRSQSLPHRYQSSTPLKRKVAEHLLPDGTQFLTHYSTDQHSVSQYFIQKERKQNLDENSDKSSKIIAQPCNLAHQHKENFFPNLKGLTITNGNNAGSSIQITTPSGRMYDFQIGTTLTQTTNSNSTSNSNNNNNNINNNISIGQPSFNFNNILGTQPINIPVNQPVNIPVNNPSITTQAPSQLSTVNTSSFYPLNIPYIYTNPNLIPRIPGINPYLNPLNNPAFNPISKNIHNLYANVPNYGPYKNPSRQGLNTHIQPAFQLPFNQDSSPVTFPNLSDSILNNTNAIVQQNLTNKQYKPPQNNSMQGSFTSYSNSNLSNSSPSYNRFIPTSNKINYGIPYTSLLKKSSNNVGFKKKL